MNRVTIETLRAGQPRPYADSEYLYRIIFELQVTYGAEKGEWKPMTHMTEEMAKAALRVFHLFKTKDQNPGWYETTMTRIEKESEGIFRIHLVAASTN